MKLLLFILPLFLLMSFSPSTPYVTYISASGTSGVAVSAGAHGKFRLVFSPGSVPSKSDKITVDFLLSLPDGSLPVVAWANSSEEKAAEICFVDHDSRTAVSFEIHFRESPAIATTYALDILYEGAADF